MKSRAIAVLTLSTLLLTASILATAPHATAGPATITPTDRAYDHLRCYRIKDPHRFAALADLLPLQNPPFHVERGCRIKATAREFCIPVHKRLGPLLSADPPIIDITGQDLVNDYLCYKVRCPGGDLPNGWPVVDQFGRRVVAGFKAKRICTPARKLPVEQACCDAAQEPGTGTIPPCVEGATCCNDGIWRCNGADGVSTCPIDEGHVCARCCNPAEEPGVDGNPFCFGGASCCATGRWHCNEGDGSSTCAVDGVPCAGCCQPSEEPGVGGNPFCIEGHTCCSDGTWRCNKGDGSSSCDLDGQACDCCDPSGEPGLASNGICIEGQSCCANGRWQCNDGSGQSTCQFEGERCGNVCGGIQGIPCADDEYCVFEDGQCCCDFQGMCVDRPEACPANVDPVCGCDGSTYGNACEAERNGVNIDHLGPCASVNATTGE